MSQGWKESWPELVGRRGREAKAVIERENGDVKGVCVRTADRVLKLCRCDRVFIMVDCPPNVDPNEGIVERIPKICRTSENQF